MTKKKKRSDPSTLTLSEQTLYFLRQAEGIAIRAKRGNKSLKGNNSYAERFSDCRTQAIRALREIQRLLSPPVNPGLEKALTEIDQQLQYFFTPKTPPADRRDLRREIERLLKTEVDLALESLAVIPPEFLPLEMLTGTRGYVEEVAGQINRSFRCNSYDACAVMIRRLLETLIIEVYEKKGLADKIKDTGGNYLMFTELVSKLVATPETPVGRTTRTELPKIAKVLNNCAHNRVFNIGRPQLVSYQTDIQIAVQELMGLWDIRPTKP